MAVACVAMYGAVAQQSAVGGGRRRRSLRPGPRLSEGGGMCRHYLGALQRVVPLQASLHHGSLARTNSCGARATVDDQRAGLWKLAVSEGTTLLFLALHVRHGGIRRNLCLRPSRRPPPRRATQGALLWGLCAAGERGLRSAATAPVGPTTLATQGHFIVWR